MSFQATEWARGLPLHSLSAKFTLLIIGSYAGTDGACFPSLATLAEDTTQSVATVRRRIRELEEIGVVARFARWATPGGKVVSTEIGDARPPECRQSSDELRLQMHVTPAEVKAKIKALGLDKKHKENQDDEEADKGEQGVADCNPPPAIAEQPSPSQSCDTPGVSPGSYPLNSNSNSSLETKPERDARARAKLAKFLGAFETRWPTAATDDRDRTARAAAELSDEDQEAALKFIGPFLEKLKADGRKHPPSGWRYLGQKPWTLLDQAKAQAPATLALLAHDSEAAKAVRVAYEVANRLAAVHGFMRSQDGGVWYRPAVTPQLLAMAKAAPSAEWATLEYQQAGAWNNFLKEFVTLEVWSRLHAGSRAPWPWPPGIDGKIYAGTGPPENLMTAEDVKDLNQLGKMTG